MGNPVSDLLSAAMRTAANAHAGQKDKAGAPYIEHLGRVAAAMSGPGCWIEMVVAWLHDTVEDTPITLEDLRSMEFPPAVVDAVDAITRRNGESWSAYIERVGRNDLARVVKLADLEDNMDIRRIPEREFLNAEWISRLRMYRKAWDTLNQLSS